MKHEEQAKEPVTFQMRSAARRSNNGIEWPVAHLHLAGFIFPILVRELVHGLYFGIWIRGLSTPGGGSIANTCPKFFRLATFIFFC